MTKSRCGRVQLNNCVCWPVTMLIGCCACIFRMKSSNLMLSSYDQHEINIHSERNTLYTDRLDISIGWIFRSEVCGTPQSALGLLRRTASDDCEVLFGTLGLSSRDGGGGVAVSMWLPLGVGGSERDILWVEPLRGSRITTVPDGRGIDEPARLGDGGDETTGLGEGGTESTARSGVGVEMEPLGDGEVEVDAPGDGDVEIEGRGPITVDVGGRDCDRVIIGGGTKWGGGLANDF